MIGRAQDKVVASEIGNLLLAVGRNAIGVLLTLFSRDNWGLPLILLVLTILAVVGMAILLRVKSRL